MHGLLQSLHEDHVNLMKLLTLVRRELQPPEQRSPDYRLILDVLDYIENYADASHHVRENQIYSHLRDTHPEHAALAVRLFDEHEQLAQSTLRAKSTLTDVLNDVILDRSDVDDSVEHYIAAQADHMGSEERQIFPLIESVFGDADWQQLGEQMRRAGDPLFGAQIEQRYQALYDALSEDSS